MVVGLKPSLGELQGGEGSYGEGIKIHRSSALSCSFYKSCGGDLLESEPHSPTLLNYATRSTACDAKLVMLPSCFLFH